MRILLLEPGAHSFAGAGLPGLGWHLLGAAPIRRQAPLISLSDKYGQELLGWGYGRSHLSRTSAKIYSMTSEIFWLLVLGILALVALAYLAVFRHRAKVEIKGPGNTGFTFDGTNEVEHRPGPSVSIERARAQGSIEGASETCGEVRLSDLDAGGDIRATSTDRPKD